MPKGWIWDPTLFAGSAAFYARGRLPYPAELPQAMATALQLSGAQRLLDVGCGPGTVALAVAHLFRDVVGIDADDGMVAEATRLASERSIRNARWRCMRAEALPAGLGRFHVATFAQSFHWMERDQVAANVHRMLEPGGVLVHVDCAAGVRPPAELAPDSSARPDEPEPPREAIDELIRRFLGPQRRAGQGVLRYGTPSGESEVVMGAGFGPPLSVFVGGGEWHRRSMDDLVAEVFASSGSAPHLFDDRIDDFERELRVVLANHSTTGYYAQQAPFMQLRIWTKSP